MKFVERNPLLTALDKKLPQFNFRISSLWKSGPNFVLIYYVQRLLSPYFYLLCYLHAYHNFLLMEFALTII